MRNPSAYTDFASSGSLLFNDGSRFHVTLSYCYSLHHSQRLIQCYIQTLRDQLDDLEQKIHLQRNQLRRTKSDVDGQAEALLSALRQQVSAYCFNRTGMVDLLGLMGIDCSSEGVSCQQKLVESLAFKQEALQRRDEFYSGLADQIVRKIVSYVGCVGAVLTEERMADFKRQLRLLLDQKCSWDSACETVLLRFNQACELNKVQSGRVKQLLCTLMANRFRGAVEQVNAVQNVLRRSGAGSRFRKDFFTDRYADFLMFLVESGKSKKTSVMKDVQLQFSMLLQGHLKERHATQLFLALGGFDLQFSTKDQMRLLFLMANADQLSQLTSTDYPDCFYGAGKESPEHARIISACIEVANHDLQVNKGSPSQAQVIDDATGEVVSTVEDRVASLTQSIELSFRALGRNVSRRTSMDYHSICNTVPVTIEAHHDQPNGLSATMNQVKSSVAEILALREKKEETRKKLACAEKLLDVLKFSVCQAIGTYLHSTRRDRLACRWWTIRNRHSQYGKRRAQALYDLVYQTASIEQLQAVIQAEMARASKGGIKGLLDSRSRCNKKSLNMYLIVAMSTLSHHVLQGGGEVDRLIAKLDNYKNRALKLPGSHGARSQNPTQALLCDGLTNTLTQENSLLFNRQLDSVVSQRRDQPHAIFYQNKKQLARHCSEIFGSWDRRRRLSSRSSVSSLAAGRTV